MKTQHTKGPWRVWNNTMQWDGYPCPIVGTNNNAVAAILAGYKQTDANVRLVAAAPSMLDALKALMECEPMASLISGTTALADATLAARAAISQAEGGQQ